MNSRDYKMSCNLLNRRNFLQVAGMGTLALFAPGCSKAALNLARKSADKVSKKPNIVFFLIDDMGWTDTGCYGSKFYKTPNIDRLARQGMRFTDAYAACPVCSPTRASIMTGKYPARLHITNWIGGAQKGKLLPPPYLHHLPLKEVTIGEAFKSAGYATCYIGKWHLGKEPYKPHEQGFDVQIATNDGGQPASYFWPYKRRKNGHSIWDVPDLADGKPGEYLTDQLTDRALPFIKHCKQQHKPFLLYFAHYAVHAPIQAKKKMTAKYKAQLAKEPPRQGPEFLPDHIAFTRQHQDNPTYAAMVQSVDESVGRVLNELDKLGLTDNTIVIFTSDNGGLSTLPWKTAPTSILPLRAGKGWLYEGGIREPLIVKWPGVVKPGSVCDTPVISTDFYPTMLEMAGLPLMPEQHKDGVSLVKLLKQTGTIKKRALYWHYPHYHGSGHTPSGAVRVGDYMLIQWYEDNHVELYDVTKDISERHNLARVMPQKARQMTAMLHKWLKDVGALMPTANPNWHPGKKKKLAINVKNFDL